MVLGEGRTPSRVVLTCRGEERVRDMPRAGATACVNPEELPRGRLESDMAYTVGVDAVVDVESEDPSAELGTTGERIAALNLVIVMTVGMTPVLVPKDRYTHLTQRA